MIKFQYDFSTGKVEEFEAKCCEHDFDNTCLCCLAKCEDCINA